MPADLSVGTRLQPHLGHRYGGQAKRTEIADRRLLEQERSAADGHEIEEGLMDLGRKVGSIQMCLDGQGNLIQAFRQHPALELAHMLPRN